MQTFEEMKFTEEEFHQLYERNNGFHEVLHDARIAPDMSFEQFMKEGCDLLIRENSDLVRSLIQ